MVSKQVKITGTNLPPVNTGNQRILRYRIVGEDGTPLSDWSTKVVVSGAAVTQVSNTLSNTGTQTFLATWGDENARPGYDVFVSYGIAVTSWSRTGSNVTLNLATQPSFTVGDKIDVLVNASSHISVTNVPVTNVTSTSVSYDCSVAGTNSGSQPGTVYYSDTYYGVKDINYSYHGTTPTHTYSFLAYPYSSAKVLIQIEGNNKVIDTYTNIALSSRVNTFLP